MFIQFNIWLSSSRHNILSCYRILSQVTIALAKIATSDLPRSHSHLRRSLAAIVTYADNDSRVKVCTLFLLLLLPPSLPPLSLPPSLLSLFLPPSLPSLSLPPSLLSFPPPSLISFPPPSLLSPSIHPLSISSTFLYLFYRLQHFLLKYEN